MNKKGDFNLQGMIIGMLVVGLFFGMWGIFISQLGANYDTTGYDSSDIEKYQIMGNISDDINSAHSYVDKVTVDKSVFDYFSDILDKILTPFKFIYRSFTTLITLTTDAVADLKLDPIIGDFFVTVLTVLVIVGIVMIKFYMGKRK
ncbi:MAG: hypothetical protein KAU20_07840 [Nanoarchaeota archaeon]|nr:hypothetical protein [Nanoarchaeota archaeon]